MGSRRWPEPIERARDCECGGRPVLGFGERECRAMCRRCGLMTRPVRCIEDAVEEWNAGRAGSGPCGKVGA